MQALKEKIRQLAEYNFQEIVKIRRHIHQNPELSNQEHQTSAFISETLNRFGIEHKKGIFDTGIVGLIKGKNPDKKVVALRADMDALPVIETNDVDYKSQNKGVMHACGHDVHMASLLGTAKILNQLRDEFEGSVKLIFQPAEEKIPGGAKFMIEEGVLMDPEVDVVLGMHVFPELEVGIVGFKAGKYMASSDEITLTIKGKGGHAAMPNILIDPVLIASHIIVGLQQIVSRQANYTIPSVLSFGEINAEGTYNVIPDDVVVRGTFRAFDEQWRKKAHESIRKMAVGIARGMGGDCEVFIDHGYPYLVNDDRVTNTASNNAKDYLGNNNVVKLGLRTTGEDFAYFAQSLPSCFYRIGTANHEKGIRSNLHVSTFNVDEEALEIGMGLMSWLTINELLTQ